ncbi:MAG TPA: MFS transporter [Anaerohalosphaeraceae bacterium]|nr:MFS transporter [Anaerohalosphaeraceae bacterium]
MSHQQKLPFIGLYQRCWDSIRTTFRSLRYRNYRLFFIGQGLSLVGTWMQQVAVSWLVYRLSHSAVALGAVAFAGQAPVFLLAPVGGITADRCSKHRILLLTQMLSMVQAAVLSVLVLSGTVQVWQIGLLSLMLGTINAFDMPTRHAFVIEMIEDSGDLGNAIALNSSMFNGARLAGPALAGVIISIFGESLCFVLNAVSYLAVILSLLKMQIGRFEPPSKPVHPVAQLKAGFAYAYRFTPVRDVIGFIAAMSLVGMPYAVLLPVLAKTVLDGGPQTYGLLIGSAGAGALFGALYMAWRKTVRGLGRILVFGGSLFGGSLLVLSAAESAGFSMALLLLCGFGMMVLMAGCNTILQTMVDDSKRGIVMSIYMMALIGMAPLGSLAAGFMAHRLGLHLTLLMGGLLCLLASGLFALRLPRLRGIVRPVYVEKGIITETAGRVQDAEE